jgi:predicted ribosomally synthesized peptide with SipW-like signal peptide
MKGRMAVAALLACALAGGGSTAAFADGENVETTVTIKKASKITKAKPGKATLSWRMEISKPDGSRPDNIHQGELTLPKGVSADVKGLKTCSLDALQRNDDKACPKGSVVGRSDASIHTPEVRAEEFAATGVIYFTGMRGKNPTFAVYYTLTEIATLHSVTQLMVTRKGKTSKLHMDQPPVPVPGLPDSTPKLIALEFTKKATPFRLSASCARGSKAAAKYGFFPTSPASHDNDVFHTRIGGALKVSAKAC